MDFLSAYAHGFARVAACTVPVTVADPARNAAAVIAAARAAHDDAVAVAVLPELCLSGYAIDDLFLQDALLESVRDALEEVVTASRDLRPVLVVGAPLEEEARAEDVDAALRRALATLSVKDAAAAVATATGLPRRTIYARALALQAGDAGDDD